MVKFRADAALKSAAEQTQPASTALNNPDLVISPPSCDYLIAVS
jgi:hypothetical protein